LRAADIELIIHRFGGEQWSEHFTFSQSRTSVAYPACERRVAVLLGAGTPIRCLGRTPIQPEVLAQIKNEILDLNDFPTFERDNTDTTVLANSA